MRENASSIRLLVADDHPIFRGGIVALIGYQPDMTVVAEAATGRELVEQFRAAQPDVALVDLVMPEINGIEAIKIIKSEFSRARIIVLTTYDTDEDVYAAVSAGADGYLVKDAPPADLLAAVRTVARGGKSLGSEIGLKLAERIAAPALTSREFEVLQLMTRGKTNREIGNSLFITESTVKAHINRILSKLGVSDRTQAVVVALKRGLARLD